MAIALLERTADDLGPTGGLSGRIDARVVDLDEGLPADIIDVDLIVCQRFRDPALTTTIIDRLSVGGYALVTVLSAVGAERPGDFHAPPAALSTEFGDDDRCDVLHHHEGDGVAHIVVRRR